MDEPTVVEMSHNRILKALQELKSKYRALAANGETKYKYYFALGHAIRALEDKEVRGVKADSPTPE